MLHKRTNLIRTNSSVSVRNFGKSLLLYFTMFAAKGKFDSQPTLTPNLCLSINVTKFISCVSIYFIFWEKYLWMYSLQNKYLVCSWNMIYKLLFLMSIETLALFSSCHKSLLALPPVINVNKIKMQSYHIDFIYDLN